MTSLRDDPLFAFHGEKPLDWDPAATRGALPCVPGTAKEKAPSSPRHRWAMLTGAELGDGKTTNN